MNDNMQPEKLPLSSPDIKTGQIDKLKSLFPEAFTEGGKPGFDQLLGNSLKSHKIVSFAGVGIIEIESQNNWQLIQKNVEECEILLHPLYFIVTLHQQYTSRYPSEQRPRMCLLLLK
ncbi:MAG: hypothetical protein EPO28_09540 [Saprospiraceae bacterium]|nr:MAG: hypothetical protein EPO28_09540 [Saprospiraceae bacterium]